MFSSSIAGPTKVLIVAQDDDTANEAERLVAAGGSEVVHPRHDESAAHALVRLKPSVAFIESGCREVTNERFRNLANALGVGVVVFGAEHALLNHLAVEMDLPIVGLHEPMPVIRSVIASVAPAPR